MVKTKNKLDFYLSRFRFQNECNRHHPPGRKIYEHPDGLSVYEVDGTQSQVDWNIAQVETNEAKTQKG